MDKQAFIAGFMERWGELTKLAKIAYPKSSYDGMKQNKERFKKRRSGRHSGEQHKQWLERVTAAHPGKLQPTTSGRHRP